MRNDLLSDIGQSTTSQNVHTQDYLWGTVAVFLEDGMGVNLQV